MWICGIFTAFFLLFTALQLKAGITFKELSLQEALDQARKENKLVFIDVYADWCGPCKYLAQNIFTDEDLGVFMNEHFVNVQLDGEAGDGLALMRQFNLTAFPTMLYLSPDGSLLKKIVGVVSADEIEQKGYDARYPEKTKIYRMSQAYQSGNREKDFLKTYILELVSEEQSAEEVVRIYLNRYPILDIRNREEFMIFSLGIHDLAHEMSQDFLKNAADYHTLHGVLVESKLEMMLMNIINEAITQESIASIPGSLDLVYPAYQAVFGENAHDRKKLEGILIYNYEKAQSAE